MRRAARIDANQPAIVDALRKIGCSVQTLSAVGGGVPDLLVGYRKRNVLLECKDGAKPPSERVLTTEQFEWHLRWHGEAYIVTSVEEAISAVTGVGQ